MLNFKNKTVLVTGSTSGIGETIARTFHKEGANVIFTGRREEKLDEITQELGERAFAQKCDLQNLNEAESLFENASKHTGNIDILICNAGINRDNLALRMTKDDFSTVLDVNLTSSFLLNKAAIKKMVRNKWGRIINISSIIGSIGNVGQANYAAAKAGMNAMTKSLALETASRNITINAIAPGFITTAMTDKLSDDIKQNLLNKIPNKKFGTPQDIANCAIFLASDLASYITGQTLHVNGGMYMN